MSTERAFRATLGDPTAATTIRATKSTSLCGTTQYVSLALVIIAVSCVLSGFPQDFLPFFAAGNAGSNGLLRALPSTSRIVVVVAQLKRVNAGFFSVVTPGISKNSLSIGAVKGSIEAQNQDTSVSALYLATPQSGDPTFFLAVKASFSADVRTWPLVYRAVFFFFDSLTDELSPVFARKVAKFSLNGTEMVVAQGLSSSSNNLACSGIRDVTGKVRAHLPFENSSP